MRKRKIEKKRDSRLPRLENYTWLLLLLFIRAVCWMRRSEDGWVGCLSSGDGICEIKVRRKGKSDRAGAIFSRCRGKSGESGASDVTTYLLDPLYDFNSLLSHCSVIPFPNKPLCPFLFPFPAPRCRHSLRARHRFPLTVLQCRLQCLSLGVFRLFSVWLSGLSLSGTKGKINWMEVDRGREERREGREEN